MLQKDGFRLTYDDTRAEIRDTHGGVLQLQSSRKTGTTFHFVWLSPPGTVTGDSIREQGEKGGSER